MAACLVVFILVAACGPSQEPAYDGHSLPYWFQRLPVLSGQPNVGFAGIYSPPQGAALTECRTALKAIKAMGTNSLPYLIQKLQVPAPSDQGRALAGLLMLCPLPPDAEQKVRDLSLNFQAPTWELALVIVKAQNDPRIVEDNLSTRQVIAGKLITIRYTE